MDRDRLVFRLRVHILEAALRGWEFRAETQQARFSAREEPDGTGVSIYFNNVYQGRIDDAWVNRLADEAYAGGETPGATHGAGQL